MRKVSAAEIDGLYLAYMADRDGRADQFWSACQAYAAWCCFTVPEWLREDLVADIVVAAMTRIDALTITKSFSKWLNGLIANMRAERYRVQKYECPETPFSQLAAEQEDGTYLEYEPSDAACPSDAGDLITPEARAKSTTAHLDALRATLTKQSDRDLFDLLRSGLSLKEAAADLGMLYNTAHHQVSRWRNKHEGNPSTLVEFPYVTSCEGSKAA